MSWLMNSFGQKAWKQYTVYIGVKIICPVFAPKTVKILIRAVSKKRRQSHVVWALC